MSFRDEIRQTVTKELLQEVTIIKFDIDFEKEIIEYLYYNTWCECSLWDDISINEFIKKCYEFEVENIYIRRRYIRIW